MKKIFIVAKKDFLKNIKKSSFWVLTLGLPLIYIIIFGVSFFTLIQSHKNIETKNNAIEKVYVYDDSGIIGEFPENKKIERVSSYDDGYNAFLGKESDIFVYYPKSFPKKKEIEIFTNSNDLVDSYGDLVRNFTKQAILSNIQDKELTILYDSNYNIHTKKFLNGKEMNDDFQKITIGFIGAFIYFLMIIFGNSTMLMSVVQEKENRAIEIILSTIHAKEFIVGKILGGLITLIFQLLVVVIIPVIIIFNLPKIIIPFDVMPFIQDISILDFFIMIFYVLGGFLVFASLMVAAGSSGSNQREAGSFSTPIILIAMLPMYFTSLIMADPTSSLAMFFSYFPFTAPMVLLFRTSIGALLGFEYFLGPIIIIAYVLLSFWIATKVFEIGALEFNKKLSFKAWFSKS